MRLALTAFTQTGKELALSLSAALAAQGHACAAAFPGDDGYALASWTAARFADSDGLIFVGAAGIAVRAIAPHIRDKFTDPAVVSVDELGKIAVPLLSGHVGGANDLARQIAALTVGTAAVSTATDLHGLFAVDQWARERGMTLTDRALAKTVSAALLAGETVGFASDLGHPCPPGLTAGPADLGVWVTCHTAPGPFPRTLRLVPRCLTLGIGCRKGTGEAAIAAAVDRAMTGLDPLALAGAATIDLKAAESGLLAFCRRRALPLTTYSAAELAAAEGAFTPSAFVQSVTGVDNVCERAAILSGGGLLVPKQCEQGVTIAVALTPTPKENHP